MTALKVGELYVELGLDDKAFGKKLAGGNAISGRPRSRWTRSLPEARR